LLVAGIAHAATLEQPLSTPAANQRHTEQTFLTYPEWFLVHSPAELAAFSKHGRPSDFPFFGHIGQFWSGYRAVAGAASAYPPNVGYHVMVVVIGVSTSVEYGVKGAYETLIGRLTELTRGAPTPEDELAATVAQEYVDFIRVEPWYRFDFIARLGRLWSEPPLVGPDMLRKWERRWALTTEYSAKAAYAVLTRWGTEASYQAEIPLTAVVLDRLPEASAAKLPELKVLQVQSDQSVLAMLPRYAAFTSYALELARQGVGFREVAGNREDAAILVTVLAPRTWSASLPGTRVLFTQPILTQPALQRSALVLPVAALTPTLVTLQAAQVEVEHVYDY
jgi:hypothetical protein